MSSSVESGNRQGGFGIAEICPHKVVEKLCKVEGTRGW